LRDTVHQKTQDGDTSNPRYSRTQKRHIMLLFVVNQISSLRKSAMFKASAPLRASALRRSAMFGIVCCHGPDTESSSQKTTWHSSGVRFGLDPHSKHLTPPE